MNNASITMADRLVERSVTSYATHHRKYDQNHPEIFNSVEQVRLRRELAQVIADSGEDRPHALDLGAGSGNVTAHLLALGAEVTAAEVSPHFIGVLRARFGAGVRAVQINGVDLTGLPDETFHIVTLYSVLHHIPDYVGIVDEIARVLRPGGQVYFDHEVTEAYWEADGCAKQLARESREFRRNTPGLWNPDRHRWQRFLVPGRYLHAIRTRRDPDYMVHREGDIHVTADDHIEWPKLIERVVACGLTVGRAGEYLNYDASNPLEIWTRYRDRGCTDMRYLVARKEAHGSAAHRG